MRTRLIAGMFVGILCLAQEAGDPWTAKELVTPRTFAAELGQSKQPAKIIAVAFPVLYRQRHIAGAVYAGPGNSAEGIEALKKEVAGVGKDADIVLYCGCCPMERCPNIRPAYKALKELGYSRVRVLNVPNNMHNDWYAKKYPSEPAMAE